MRKSHLLSLSLLAAALLASSAANAGIINVGGVYLPTTAVPGPGAVVLDLEATDENILTAPTAGQQLAGIAAVKEVEDGSSNTIWTNGVTTGTYLGAVFKGFTVITSVAPTALTDGEIFFSGGGITYYTSNVSDFHSDSSNGGTGTQAGDIAAMESGTPWLVISAKTTGYVDSATGATCLVPLGTCVAYTLEVTIPHGDNFGNFVNSSTNQLIGAVTGGVAKNYFDTNSVPNLQVPGELDDVVYNAAAGSIGGDLGTGCPATNCDFDVNGHAQLQGRILVTPEPISISLFGAGVAGAAAVARRRKAKKA